MKPRETRQELLDRLWRDSEKERKAMPEFTTIIAEDGDLELDWLFTNGDMFSIYVTPRGDIGYSFFCPSDARKSGHGQVATGQQYFFDMMLRAFPPGPLL